MTKTLERPQVVPNASSRLVDIRIRVTGVGTGLIDAENHVRPEWANPTTIGDEIEKLIKQTNDSMHGFQMREGLAEKLAIDMEALLRAKNAVNAIQVLGIFADVTQSARFFAANTVARMIIEPSNEDQMVALRTKLAAELGHRQSKRVLMTSHRVSLGQ